MDSRTAFGIVFGLWMTLTPASSLAQTPANTPIRSDAEIGKILKDHVGAENLGIGIVVGVIDAKGRRIIAYGTLAKDDKRPLNGDTIFEIGSITKVFTSLLLMDMAEKREVSVTDAVSKYLPAEAKAPERNGARITLQDLATHRSGLPAEPFPMTNPYYTFTIEQFYDFLAGYKLTRDVGSQFEYSNIGVALLGHALSLRARISYEELIKTRILGPLGMRDTQITLPPETKTRLAVGHDSDLKAVPNLDSSTRVPLAPAGALLSSANDLLRFLAANLGYTKTPLASAMAAALSIRWPTLPSMTGMEIAYNWIVQTKNGKSIIWHNGATPGYRAFVGFDSKSRTGVVVLSNRFWPSLPDDLGRHLLDQSYPLP